MTSPMQADHVRTKTALVSHIAARLDLDECELAVEVAALNADDLARCLHTDTEETRKRLNETIAAFADPVETRDEKIARLAKDIVSIRNESVGGNVTGKDLQAIGWSTTDLAILGSAAMVLANEMAPEREHAA